MTTFREFLSYRNVINEDAKAEWEKIENDPKIKALENFKKEKGFTPTGIPPAATDDQKKNYVKFLNDFIIHTKGNSAEKFADWDDAVDTWKKYSDEKKVHDVDTNDVADESVSNKEEYLKTALREGGRIKNVFFLPPDVAENIANAFAKADKSNNKDGKIDKEEFINAIKFIKKQAAFKSREINATNIASLLYFVYLTRAVKSDKKNGLIISGYLIRSKVKGLNDEKIQDLNEKYLKHFSGLKFDSKVLSIFAKPNDAAAFIKSTNQEADEEQFEKIRNSLSDDDDAGEPEISSKDKKSKKKEEETEEQKQAAKEVDEAKKAVDDNDEKVEELKRQKEEMEKTPETGREQAVSKKKFYIFDIDTPEPSDDVGEWFKKMGSSSFAGGAMGMIDKIRKELDEYEPKSNENDLSEAITKVFKKNGIILEDYSKTKGKINKLIGDAEEKIRNYLEGAQHKAESLQTKIESNSSYTATVELRRQFKQLFIDLGYVLSQEVRALVRATNLKMDSLKNAKRRETLNGYKTTEQRGQEELDANNIIKIINGVNVSRDDQHIARFMLINLLNGENSSEKVLECLNAKAFDSRYVYRGSSGLIYALSKNDVEVDDKLGNGITLYNFKRARARVYKNPADLIETAVGIKVSSLTPDVLKVVKKEAAARAGEAEKYLSSAKAIADMVSKLGGIPLSEGIMDFIRTKDTTKNSDFKELNTTLANKEQKQGVADVMGAIQNCSYEINLDKEFQPQGNGPEDIALRQIFKGFCLIDAGGKRYVSTYDAIKKSIASAEATKRHQESEEMKKATDTTHIVEPELNKSDQSHLSVVTSTNADSTYGDGYGYNKKTDAIKKKLNSTTYTYMPNSKMRIVRRTFD